MLRGVLSVRLGDGPRGVFEPAPPLFTRVDIAGPVPQGLLVRGKAQRRTGVDAQSDQSVRKVDEMMMSKQKVYNVSVTCMSRSPNAHHTPSQRTAPLVRCPLGQQKLHDCAQRLAGRPDEDQFAEDGKQASKQPI